MGRRSKPEEKRKLNNWKIVVTGQNCFGCKRRLLLKIAHESQEPLTCKLTCFSIFRLTFALHLLINWNHRHLVDGVSLKASQDNGGCAT